MTSNTYSTGSLSFAFPGHPLLLGFEDFHLTKGKITVITGENGSGKTTLLRILAGLLKPFTPISGQLQNLIENSVYLHQDPYLFRGTVARNLSLANSGADTNEIVSVLETVGLSGFEHRIATNLSGGESKRVALARCFLSHRWVLLLDEPDSHADAPSVALIENACRKMAAQGRTIVLTSHRGSFCYRVADRIVELTNGKLVPTTENILKGRSLKEADGHMY